MSSQMEGQSMNPDVLNNSEHSKNVFVHNAIRTVGNKHQLARKKCDEIESRPLGLEDRLAAMENTLAEIFQMLADRQPRKDWYSVRELAEILTRSEFTVREWCRLNRVHAAKRACGRGNSTEWIVSAAELKRIQNEGLLPVRNGI